jgi:hypothetical protein
VSVDAALTEERIDCGRPTFVEAGTHRRFKCRHAEDSTAKSSWGYTVDLGKLAEAAATGISGYAERVCGPVPREFAPPGSEAKLRVRFLGAPEVPRADPLGVGDEDFAALLEREEQEMANGRPLREQLKALRE